MAYDKVEIFEKAKEAVKKHKLFFTDDIIAFLPCSRSTFYEYYPKGSDELDELKELLEINRVSLKVSMRSKWYNSNSPALQMALMKLIGSPEELRRLSMSYQEIDQKTESVSKITITDVDGAEI